MPTPEIHAADAAAPFVVLLSSITMQWLGLPFGAVAMAAMGAAWAVWRKTQLEPNITRKHAAVWLFGGFAAGVGLVAFAVELLEFTFGFKPSLQGLTGIIAFTFIDKPWRDKLFGFFSAKAEDIKVKND